ncbi:metabolite traffic protein EboE [Acidobacteria bacterium AH-259-O06]|nr:metabolite traffic protein EboE [Acidobacteria bacterium AH-259-O06]
MKLAQKFHLTYCSNIHPGETWEEVHQNLATFLPAIRQKLCLNGPFGVGLRLSAQAAETLEKRENLMAFQEFLAARNCYVFTINGFPYGVFHRARVKEEVYLPDWKDEARLDYTNRLARILSMLLPDEPDLQGSISTVPGAFKREVRSREDVRQMARLMLKQVAVLHALREQTGKIISLALEPEPCCYLETVDEAVAFFQDYVFNPELLQTLVDELGVSPAQAEETARRHIGVCYDACHMAVEFEEAADALGKLKAAGIKICKFQISSALKLHFKEGDGRAEETLLPFAESTYLHQVVEKSQEGLVRYIDLPEGLAEEARARSCPKRGREKEWRVHFHVPIFLGEMKNFGTTQDHLVSLINFLKSDTPCPYLEVETYTWDVLLDEYKTLDTASAIARELAWVRDRIHS